MKGWQDVPVPDGLAQRPRDNRGYPITFVTLITSDGRPDFTTVDGQKILACIKDGLCGLCGIALEENGICAFIGGPLSIENRNFLDAPMHLTCAQYAMQVCPHIAIDTSRYSKPKLDDGEGRSLFAGVSDERPDRFGMLICPFQSIVIGVYQEQPVFLVDSEATVGVRWQGEV